MATKTRTATIADSVNITNMPEVIAAARRAAELKQIEKAGKEAEAERKELEETILRPALAGATKAVLRGVVAFKLGASSNSHVDGKSLLMGWPEAYAACLRKTPYTFFTYNLG